MRVETPASVRTRLIAEHEALRDAMHELQARRPRDDVRARGLSLIARRTLEMTAMDLLLGPILHDIDAWGPQRETALYASHDAQTGVLRTIGDVLRDASAEIEAPLIAFLAALARHLRAEEGEFLLPTLLRDDPVTIDEFGG